MQLMSPAFKSGREIPERYSLEGEDISPPLSWQAAPPETRSFAILCDDPDVAGEPFHHWAVCDIPPNRTRIDEGYPRVEYPGAAHQAINDFGMTGYDGMHPPYGVPHRYRFRLLALDVDHLEVGEHPTCDAVRRAAEGHTISHADLVGMFVD